LSELPRLVEPGVRQGLMEACEAEGFRWVTVDLAGYQAGGLAAAGSQATDPRGSTPPLVSAISS
jgi:hypothetical protein